MKRFALRIDSEIESGSSDLQQNIQYEKNHGREEIRCCYTLVAEGWYDRLDLWQGLYLFIAMDRMNLRDGKSMNERSYYISSLLGTDRHINTLIRQHWQVEVLHFMLDVTFHEDVCRVRDPQIR